MLAFQQPNRQAVAISSLNRGIVTGQLVLPGSSTESWQIEVDLTTNPLVTSFANATPPDPVSVFQSAMGAFVNVFCYSDLPGIEVRIHLAVDGFGSATFWRLALSQIVTPGVLSIIDAFRVNQTYARVQFVNTTGGLLFGEYAIKMVTL